ncbi:MAG: cysteine peptidase family C39 domain-containing protein, partial [Candidatus Margulisiibacteriota bacterium]
QITAGLKGVALTGIYTNLDALIGNEPFIAHLTTNGGHFVVVKEVTGTTVTYIDDGIEKTVDHAEFEGIWQGNALVVGLPSGAYTPLTEDEMNNLRGAGIYTLPGDYGFGAAFNPSWNPNIAITGYETGMADSTQDVTISSISYKFVYGSDGKLASIYRMEGTIKHLYDAKGRYIGIDISGFTIWNSSWGDQAYQTNEYVESEYHFVYGGDGKLVKIYKQADADSIKERYDQTGKYIGYSIPITDHETGIADFTQEVIIDTITYYFVYGSDGKLAGIYKIDVNNNNVIYRFDKDGNYLGAIYVEKDAAGKISKVYKYDVNGRLTGVAEITVENLGGVDHYVLKNSTIIYDNDGNIIAQIWIKYDLGKMDDTGNVVGLSDPTKLTALNYLFDTVKAEFNTSGAMFLGYELKRKITRAETTTWTTKGMGITWDYAGYEVQKFIQDPNHLSEQILVPNETETKYNVKAITRTYIECAASEADAEDITALRYTEIDGVKYRDVTYSYYTKVMTLDWTQVLTLTSDDVKKSTTKIDDYGWRVARFQTEENFTNYENVWEKKNVNNTTADANDDEWVHTVITSAGRKYRDITYANTTNTTTAPTGALTVPVNDYWVTADNNLIIANYSSVNEGWSETHETAYKTDGTIDALHSKDQTPWSRTTTNVGYVNGSQSTMAYKTEGYAYPTSGAGLLTGLGLTAADFAAKYTAYYKTNGNENKTFWDFLNDTTANKGLDLKEDQLKSIGLTKSELQQLKLSSFTDGWLKLVNILEQKGYYTVSYKDSQWVNFLGLMGLDQKTFNDGWQAFITLGLTQADFDGYEAWEKLNSTKNLWDYIEMKNPELVAKLEALGLTRDDIGGITLNDNKAPTVWSAFKKFMEEKITLWQYLTVPTISGGLGLTNGSDLLINIAKVMGINTTDPDTMFTDLQSKLGNIHVEEGKTAFDKLLDKIKENIFTVIDKDSNGTVAGTEIWDFLINRLGLGETALSGKGITADTFANFSAQTTETLWTLLKDYLSGKWQEASNVNYRSWDKITWYEYDPMAEAAGNLWDYIGNLTGNRELLTAYINQFVSGGTVTIWNYLATLVGGETELIEIFKGLGLTDTQIGSLHNADGTTGTLDTKTITESAWDFIKDKLDDQKSDISFDAFLDRLSSFGSNIFSSFDSNFNYNSDEDAELKDIIDYKDIWFYMTTTLGLNLTQFGLSESDFADFKGITGAKQLWNKLVSLVGSKKMTQETLIAYIDNFSGWLTANPGKTLWNYLVDLVGDDEAKLETIIKEITGLTDIASIKAALTAITSANGNEWGSLLSALGIASDSGKEKDLISRFSEYIQNKFANIDQMPGLWHILVDIVGDDNKDALTQVFLAAFGFDQTVLSIITDITQITTLSLIAKQAVWDALPQNLRDVLAAKDITNLDGLLAGLSNYTGSVKTLWNYLTATDGLGLDLTASGLTESEVNSAFVGNILFEYFAATTGMSKENLRKLGLTVDILSGWTGGTGNDLWKFLTDKAYFVTILGEANITTKEGFWNFLSSTLGISESSRTYTMTIDSKTFTFTLSESQIEARYDIYYTSSGTAKTPWEFMKDLLFNGDNAEVDFEAFLLNKIGINPTQYKNYINDFTNRDWRAKWGFAYDPITQTFKLLAKAFKPGDTDYDKFFGVGGRFNLNQP